MVQLLGQLPENKHADASAQVRILESDPARPWPGSAQLSSAQLGY